MKKLLFLPIIFLLVLVLPLSLADEIRVPITQPKTFFSFFSVFPDTLNGLSCDATADATKIFISSDTMSVGVSCGNNAYVNLYSCQDSSCSNYASVGRKAKVNGIEPIYSGLGVGNQYIYFCYNCGQTTQPITCYYCGGGIVQSTTSNVYAEYGGCEKYPYQEPKLYSSPPTCSGCSPNWKCAIAGDCINGVQKLYCYDVNNCNSNVNKPAETQSCVISNTCIYNNLNYVIGNVIDECSSLGRKTTITGRNFGGNCQTSFESCVTPPPTNCAKEGEKTKFNFPCCSGLVRDFSGFAGIGDTCIKPESPQNITKCNPETLENCPRKLTIKAEKLSSSTLADKLASQCERSIECRNNNCISLKKLEEEGFITTKDADSVSAELKGTLTGTGIGAVGGLALCVAGAGFLGFTTGGLLTFPILIGVCSGGGALTGGIAGYWSSKGIKAIQAGDKEAYGFCIEEGKKEPLSFTKFVDSIGKGVNEAFGGKAKTQISDTTMGWIVLIVVFIIILMIFTRK